MFLFQYLLLFY